MIGRDPSDPAFQHVPLTSVDAERAALLDVVESIEAELYDCGERDCKEDRCLMARDIRNVIAKAWTRHDVGVLTRDVVGMGDPIDLEATSEHDQRSST